MASARQGGQLLLEAVVAMAIVGIIITGIVVALNYSVNNSIISKDQNIATNYAQEGLDIVRNMKDSDFASFAALNGAYCLASGTVPVSGTCNPIGGVGGKFTRQIYVYQDGIDGRTGTRRCTDDPIAAAVFVASVVTWSDNRCTNQASPNCHTAELNSCFVDPAKVYQ